MKKYFTKFLPVEGEIKEGDRVLYDKELLLVSDASKRDLFTDSHGDLYEYIEVKKVKLFLCSQWDVRVGEDIRFENFTGKATPRLIEAGAFKVIGEVSPDALTYVSDKEKYDEEDIKIFIKSWALGWIPYEPELSLFSEDTEGPPYEYQIRIKGPCGHFH